MSEFSLIEKYFSRIGKDRKDVLLGVGDDAAVVNISQSTNLAISTDTLLSGVHFPENTSAFDIGWKSLAVNLSDMAAMGAEPCWSILAISLPEANESWLQDFSRGFSELALQNHVQLIGGDTTRGPLSITVQIIGQCTENHVLTRSAAKPGDRIFITGTLGDAALALKYLFNQTTLKDSNINQLLNKLNRPNPRLDFAKKQKHLIHAAIDISDGLYADLQHILQSSQVGAEVHLDQLPLSLDYAKYVDEREKYDLALTGGDDYELCVTVPEQYLSEFIANAAQFSYPISEVGIITDKSELELFDEFGKRFHVQSQAYNHFARKE